METHVDQKNLVARASATIQSSAQNVWNALTDPEANKHFMFGTQVETDWKKNSSIKWKGEWKGKPFEDKGVVLQVVPGRVLQYTHFSPLSGQVDKPENYHHVTITLSEEDYGVFVALTQDKNDSEESVKHSEANWNMMLQGLKDYVEKNDRKDE